LTMGSLSGRNKKYHDVGTWFANIKNQEDLRVGINSNFSHGSDERTKALFRDVLLAQGYKIIDKGCPGCMVKCWKIIITPDGEVLNKADYETFSLNGPNLEIYKPEDIASIVKMTDHLGLDAISNGTSIGYLLEQEKRFGDVNYVKDVVQAIAAGKHPLARGLFRYAGNAPNAMHVKGLPFAAYLANLNPAVAIALLSHMSHDSYNAWCYKDDKSSATNSLEEWIENGIRGSQIMLYDMNGLCKFLKADFNQVGQLFKHVYGKDVSPDELRKTARLVNLLGRVLDERLGFRPEDEVLPARCHEDFGFLIPHFNTPEFFNAFKEGFYKWEKEARREYGLVL